MIYAFSILGGNLTVITPSKYAPAKAVLGEVKNYCKISGAKIKLATSLQPSVQNADVLYTDVWTSMGKEKESRIRKKAFKSFQINDKILKLARKDCMVMHCLPAHRGEEITDSVIDSKNSVVFTQAENRLHTAKAILTYIVNK